MTLSANVHSNYNIRHNEISPCDVTSSRTFNKRRTQHGEDTGPDGGRHHLAAASSWLHAHHKTKHSETDFFFFFFSVANFRRQLREQSRMNTRNSIVAWFIRRGRTRDIGGEARLGWSETLIRIRESSSRKRRLDEGPRGANENDRWARRAKTVCRALYFRDTSWDFGGQPRSPEHPADSPTRRPRSAYTTFIHRACLLSRSITFPYLTHVASSRTYACLRIHFESYARSNIILESTNLLYRMYPPRTCHSLAAFLFELYIRNAIYNSRCTATSRYN